MGSLGKNQSEQIELQPSYFLSQQRPSLQGSLGLVLLSDGQQRLEELCRLRRENFEGAGVEELTGALWRQACNTAEHPVVRTLPVQNSSTAAEGRRFRLLP